MGTIEPLYGQISQDDIFLETQKVTMKICVASLIYHLVVFPYFSEQKTSCSGPVQEVFEES